MTGRSFSAGVVLVLALAGVLRTVWLTSDPPTHPGVGVVWHDEGPWVHNARNRVLWGEWRTDEWNPMFLAPVFTGAEYLAFRSFGVGTWQARVVPAVSGIVAIVFLMAGLTATAGRRAALIGGALLAINYAFVMWNRAALMESTMTAFIVMSWGAYALAQQRRGASPVSRSTEPSADDRIDGRARLWGAMAGLAAVLAFFTKASAAFFVAGIVAEAASVLVRPSADQDTAARSRTAAIWVLAGLVGAGAVIGLVFVLPHWTEYRFYNWQMSVARKPQYTLPALIMRASWLPLVHDFFTWMWPVLAAACVASLQIACHWRRAQPAERLLLLWVLVGLIELVVHDSGNERRYVMFIPAIVGLAAVLFGRGPRTSVRVRPMARWLVALLALGLGYLVAGSGLRVLSLPDVRAGHLHTTVLWSSEAAAIAAAFVWIRWAAVVRWLERPSVPPIVAAAAIGVTMAIDSRHLAAWASGRSTDNYQASIDVGRLLAPGTLVQGKLANGLDLENRIRPIFIGHDFGNYRDRLQRDDVRYILTYVSPSVGFESQAESDMIQELLDRYPHRRVVTSFAVNETGGPDRAALIDKVPGTDARAPD